ncbi:MAG: sodium-dependent transporter, partial [Bacillota bacterium]
ESNVAGFSDKFAWDKKKITLVIIILLFIVGLIFSTKAGLYWLDIVDHYINSYGLIIGGILEAIAIGWFYGPEKLRSYFNPISEYKFGKWWNVMIKFFIPIVLTFLLVRNFIADLQTPYEGYNMASQWIGGWGMVIAVGVVSYIISKTKSHNVTLDNNKVTSKNRGGE